MPIRKALICPITVVLFLLNLQQQVDSQNLLDSSLTTNLLEPNIDLGLNNFVDSFLNDTQNAITSLWPVQQQQQQLVVALQEPSQEQLDNALHEPSVRCGQVPIFEKAYNRSINETFQANPDGDFRILHGLDARPGEWPWIARIKECAGPTCGSCTGSLLSSRWMITAGHCGFNRTRVDQYEAVVGLYDLITPDKGSVKVQFDKLIVHPDYKDLNNDLMLLRLKTPIQFNDHIQPLCLMNATRNVLAFTKNRKCYSVGYGLLEDMAAAIKLQKLEILAQPASECNSHKLNTIHLRSGTICIGPAANKIGGSCRGDSGGPNHCYDPNTNQWYLIGTVSYGPADCDRGEDTKWLTVSADVSNYRTWILSTVLANS